MFKRLQNWLANKLKTDKTEVSRADITDASAHSDHEKAQHVVPYDENLLERCRTQWQFGDWASLAALERDTLQHHPDRAKLALLAAAGHSALGNSAEARQYTRLALDWGCSKKLVSQILIAGVHNTLGRVAAVSGQEQCALQHFQASLQVGAPQSDVRLLAQARVSQQFSQLGLSAPALQMTGMREASNPFVARLNVPTTTPLEAQQRIDCGRTLYPFD